MKLIILVLAVLISVGLDLSLLPALFPSWPILIGPVVWSLLAWRYQEEALVAFLLVGFIFDAYSSSRFGYWLLALTFLLLAYIFLKKFLRNDLLYIVTTITLANAVTFSLSQNNLLAQIFNLSSLLSIVSQIILGWVFIFFYQKKSQKSAYGIINIPS